MRAIVASKLYVIPGSHPSLTAELMLERKGIPFKRVDLIPGPIKQGGCARWAFRATPSRR